jgi:response regulator RpfG family c-di-GMP phosphodiesterase
MSQSVPERPRVLVVDDEKFIRDILADFLGMEGYLVRTAEDGAAALIELEKGAYDLVISDLKMPKMGGIELLAQVSRQSPNALTVIMTGFGTVETAIDAMKRGAYDYILKPFKVEEVLHVVHRGLDKQRLAAENMRLKEALSLYKVSEAIQSSLSLEEVLSTLVTTALDELEGDVVTVFLRDADGQLFERQRVLRTAAPGVRGPGQVPGSGATLPLQESEVGRLDAKCLEGLLSAAPFLLEHGTSVARFFNVEPQRPVHSLLVLPLATKTRALGMVALASYSPRKRFDEGQRKMLTIVSQRAAAAIENARLYEDLRATFHQTIEGLAKAIDKMDRYTAGHSERVAVYASFLARRLGMPAELVEVVRQSALLHDIGKIGCTLNLNKPGKLTSDEYEVFQQHPGFGRDILEPIKFLNPLIPGVHLHHERWDGRGYPLGLKGNDVPLIARIIAIADTYDAMTSDRAYRRALPHEVATGEIERCSGAQFDPEIANIFQTGLEDYREAEAAAGRKVPE